MTETPMTAYEPPVSPIEDETIQGYDDSEVSALRSQVEAEQQRRSRLQTMPWQIASMVQQYVNDGGDRATVDQAIDNALNPPAPEQPTE